MGFGAIFLRCWSITCQGAADVTSMDAIFFLLCVHFICRKPNEIGKEIGSRGARLHYPFSTGQSFDASACTTLFGQRMLQLLVTCDDGKGGWSQRL